jgi:hypothetical protein
MPINEKSLTTLFRKCNVVRLDINTLFYVNIFKILITNILYNYFNQK